MAPGRIRWHSMPMDPVGIATVAVVLVAGTAGGVWRNRTSGRLRDVPASKEHVTVAMLPGSAEGRRLDPALLAGLGVEPGERATLLQFSSAHCAPCRALRRISAEVAEQLPGVRHVEVDAESHL